MNLAPPQRRRNSLLPPPPDLTALSTLASAALLLASPAHTADPLPQINLQRHHAPKTSPGSGSTPSPPPKAARTDLLNDPRFKPFLQPQPHRPPNLLGRQPSPSRSRPGLPRVPGRVLGDDNRYVTVDGCVPHFCPDRGLLWVDLGLPKPLVVFAAIDWITDNRATDDNGRHLHPLALHQPRPRPRPHSRQPSPAASPAGPPQPSPAPPTSRTSPASSSSIPTARPTPSPPPPSAPTTPPRRNRHRTATQPAPKAKP